MPLDFSTYAAERRAGYTPRPWLMKRIATWYSDPAKPRFFSIVGEPGSGKTAIAAQLLTGTAPPIAAHHFCSARSPNWREPNTFVQSMAGQLADRIPGFAEARLASLQPRHSMKIQATVQAGTAEPGSTLTAVSLTVNAGSALQRFALEIRDPLQRLYDEGFSGDVVLLVDALDEGDHVPPQTEKIGDLLHGLNDLPERVRAIVTSRPALPVERLGTPSDVVRLQLGDAELAGDVGDDVERHVRSTLAATPAIALRLALPQPQFVRQFRERAAGNFLWTVFALGMLSESTQPIDEAALQALPSGLPHLYDEFLGRIVGDDMDRWRNEHSLVLGTLAVAQEELTVNQLAHYTGLSKAIIHEVLGKTDQLLESTATTPPAYRLYHQSFLDYILDEDAAKRYACRPRDQHARFAEAWALDTGLRQWDRSDDYSIRRIATHLAGLAADERWRAALFALLSREWMEAKRARLITDVSFASDVAIIAATAASMKPRRIVEEVTARCVLATLRSRVASIPGSALALMARLGDPARAIGWASLLDDRSRGTTLLAIAEAIAGRDPELEERLLRQVADHNVRDVRAFELLVRNLTRRGRLDEATEAARAVLPDRAYAPAVIELFRALLAEGRFDAAREIAMLVDDEHGRRSLLTGIAAAMADAGRIDELIPRIDETNLGELLPHIAAVDPVRALQLASDSWGPTKQVLSAFPPETAVGIAEKAGLLEKDAVQEALCGIVLEHGLREARLIRPVLRKPWLRSQVAVHEALLRLAEEGIEAAEKIVAEAGDDATAGVRAALAPEVAALGKIDEAAHLIAALPTPYDRIEAAGAAMRKILHRDRLAQAALPLVDAMEADRKELLPRLVLELSEAGLFEQWPVVRAAARDEDERAHVAAAAGEAARSNHGPAAALEVWRDTKPWPGLEVSRLAMALLESGEIHAALEVLPEVGWLDAEAVRTVTSVLSRRGDWERAGELARRFRAGSRLRAVLLADRLRLAGVEPPLREVVRWLDADLDIVAAAVVILGRRACFDAAYFLTREGVDADDKWRLIARTMRHQRPKPSIQFLHQHGHVIPLDDAVEAITEWIETDGEPMLTSWSWPEPIRTAALVAARELPWDDPGLPGGSARARLLAWLAARADTDTGQRAGMLDRAVQDLQELPLPPPDAATAVAIACARVSPAEAMERLAPISQTVEWEEVLAREPATFAPLEPAWNRDSILDGAITRLAEEHDWDGAARLLCFGSSEYWRRHRAAAVVERAVADAASGLTRKPFTTCVTALREAGIDLDAIVGDSGIKAGVRAAVAAAAPDAVRPYSVERLAVALVETGEIAGAWKAVGTIEASHRGSAAASVARALFVSADMEGLSTVRSLEPPLIEEAAAAVAHDLIEKDPVTAAALFLELTAGVPRTWTSWQFASELARAGLLEEALRIAEDERAADDWNWRRGQLAVNAVGHVSVDLLFDVAPAEAVAGVVARLVETDGAEFARKMWDAWRSRTESPANLTLAARAFLDGGDADTARALLDELLGIMESVEDTYQRNYALLDFVRYYLDSGDKEGAQRALSQIPAGTHARALVLEALARAAAERGERELAWKLIDEALFEAVGEHEEIAARLVVLDLDLGRRTALEAYRDHEGVEHLLTLADALGGGERGTFRKRWSKDRLRRVILEAALEHAGDDVMELAKVAAWASRVHRRTATMALRRAEQSGREDATALGMLAIACHHCGDSEACRRHAAGIRPQVARLPSDTRLCMRLEIAAAAAAYADDVALAAAVMDRGLLLADFDALEALRAAVKGFSENPSMLLAAAEHLRTRPRGEKQAVIARAMADCAIRVRHAGFLAEALAALQEVEYDISPVIGDTLRQLADADPKPETIAPWIAAAEREIARNPNPESAIAQRAELAAIRFRRGQRDVAFEALWKMLESPHLLRPGFFHVLSHSMPMLRSLDHGRTWRTIAERILDVETWWRHRPSDQG